MISMSIGCFDLRRICNSGQIFRMYERENGVFDVFSGSRHLRLWQADNGSGETGFFCTQEEFDGYWRRYFDLDRDYEAIVGKAFISDRGGEDVFLTRACGYGAGIRILHQDIWEMLISFIISQQKQIPSIRKCIEALCERFGEKKCETLPADHFYRNGKSGTEYAGCKKEGGNENIQCTWYTFPTAEAIAKAGPDGLKGLSLGYRERYIYETSVRYLSEGLPREEVESMGLEKALGYFKSFCGVGEKVANCICLFGAGYVDAFPIDTHIKDILYREYYLRSKPCAAAAGGGKKSEHGLTQADYEELVRVHFDRFRGYRGIVQQWIFAWELVRKPDEILQELQENADQMQ